MEYSTNFDLETSVEETKYFLEQQYLSIDSIKKHGRDLLTSISIIIAIIAAFNLNPLTFSSIEFTENRTAILVITGMYILIVLFNAFVLLPINMHTPIKIKFESFEKIYFNKGPKTILENKLANYLNAVENNRSTIKRLLCFSYISTASYMLIIIILLTSFFS